jgi:hypothetical protein
MPLRTSAECLERAETCECQAELVKASKLAN